MLRLGEATKRLECFPRRLKQVLRPRPTDGVLDQGRAGLNLKLLADVDAVGLDRLRAQVQPLADFMGCQALAYQVKDFKFPVGQLVEEGGSRPCAGGGRRRHPTLCRTCCR